MSRSLLPVLASTILLWTASARSQTLSEPKGASSVESHGVAYQLGKSGAKTEHTDSALASGIVDLSLGATLLGLGFLVSDEAGQGALVGSGLGTLAVGIPLLATGASRVRYARQSEDAYAGGTALISLGGTLSGFGAGLAMGNQVNTARLNREYPEHGFASADLGPGVAFAVVGAAVALGGAGLMSYGAHEASPEDIAQRAERRAHLVAAATKDVNEDGTVPRSVELRTTGQVLVVIGGLSFVGAAISGVGWANCGGQMCGFGHLFTTFPLIGHGIITTAIGVPLWVSGAGHVRPDELASESNTMPEVSIGAGTASVTARF